MTGNRECNTCETLHCRTLKRDRRGNPTITAPELVCLDKQCDHYTAPRQLKATLLELACEHGLTAVAAALNSARLRLVPTPHQAPGYALVDQRTSMEV